MLHRNQGAPPTLRGLLHPDEQLLWWSTPRLKYMRNPLQASDLLWSVGAGLAFALLFLLVQRFLFQEVLPAAEQVRLVVCFWLCCVLVMIGQTWGRTFTRALKHAPAHWRFTLYALTNRRALVVLTLPGTPPVVCCYLPGEIEQPISTAHADGSGTIVFGAPRQVQPAPYRAVMTLSASFVGITDVEQVRALLLQLKARAEGDSGTSATSR